MAQQPLDEMRPDGVVWKSIAICFLLVLAIWIVFGQTLRYEFVNYDDDSVVYENPAVTRGLDVQEIVWVFTHDSGRDSWFPITDVSHMLDWQLYGPNAGGHHLTNVLLHAATALVLFLLLQNLTGAVWRSAFVAAVFAIHPLRVESVAWVAERKDVLSGLFFMLALWTWTRHLQKRAEAEGSQAPTFLSALNPGCWTADYFLVLLFFVLGLLSKAILVTLPFVMLLLDFWPLCRFNSLTLSFNASTLQRFNASTFICLLLEKWPFFLLSAAGCAVTVLTQRHVVLAADHFSLPWRMGNALLAYLDYLQHTIYPVGLAMLYPHPQNQLPVAKVCLAAIILLTISAVALISWRKHPYFLIGWLWYLGTFVPVIGMMQTGDQARADRYTYLPQIGLCILVAWGVPALLESLIGATNRGRHLPLQTTGQAFSLSQPVLRSNTAKDGRERAGVREKCLSKWQWAVLAPAAGILIAGLLIMAHVQTTYWQNSVTLWNRTLACWPESYIAHCNLGIALADEGQVTEAVRHFNRALEINPADAKSISNLGKILTSQGKLAEAVQDFNHALQLEPDDVKTLNNLGVALADEGKWNDAIQQLDRVLQIKPEDASACFNLGNIFEARQDLDDAEQYYNQALQINPDFAEAHCNLGLALARQGKWDDAIEQYEQAIRLKPHYVDALNNLGGAWTAQGNWAEAIQNYQQVIQLKPNDPNVLNNLGVALARQGNPDQAIEDFNRALQLNPNNPSTHNNLGITLAKEGKLSQAIQHLQEALYLARAQNNIALEESVSARLKQYQSGATQTQTP